MIETPILRKGTKNLMLYETDETKDIVTQDLACRFVTFNIITKYIFVEK